MKILITRYGGIGDTLILQPVARTLKRAYPGATIHFAMATDLNDDLDYRDLFIGHPSIDVLHAMRRDPIGQDVPMQLIEMEDGEWITTATAYKRFDLVFDFINSVENNTQNGHLSAKMGNYMLQQNSNYQNWIDLSLGWANVDPATVPNRYKRPEYFYWEHEQDWAEKMLMPSLKGEGEPIVFHGGSSSLPRTFFKDQQFLKALGKMGPVLWWNNEAQAWYLIKDNLKRCVLNARDTGPRQGNTLHPKDHGPPATVPWDHLHGLRHRSHG